MNTQNICVLNCVNRLFAVILTKHFASIVAVSNFRLCIRYKDQIMANNLFCHCLLCFN